MEELLQTQADKGQRTQSETGRTHR